MSCDTAHARINRPASDVFDFMADPLKLDLWSFGTWHIDVQDGLVLGRSIFDGSSIVVRVEAHRQQMLVDYQIGKSADALASRIFARIVAGEHIGADQHTSLLLLTAVRSDDMDDDRWQGLKTSHAFEVRSSRAMTTDGKRSTLTEILWLNARSQKKFNNSR